MGSSRRTRSHGEHGYGLFTVAVSRVQRLTPSYVRVSLTGPALRYAAYPIASGGLGSTTTTDRMQPPAAAEVTVGECESYRGVLDGYIKLLIPPASDRDELGRIRALHAEPVQITLDDSWRTTWFALPESERGWMRTYTLRASRLRVPDSALEAVCAALPAHPEVPTALTRPARRLEDAVSGVPEGALPEVDVDFVLHAEKDADGVERMGPGATWASQARVGDRVSLLAPLYGYPLWASWSAAGAQRIILAVDETAVPAVLSILAEYAAESAECARGNGSPALPEGKTGPIFDVLVEVPERGDTVEALWSYAYPHLPEVADLPNVRVHWCARGQDGAAKERGSALATSLRHLLGVEETGVPATQSPEATRAPGAASSGKATEAGETAEEPEVLWGLADQQSPQRYVFIAGEASTVKALRRICVNEALIPKNEVSFMGYWRVGRTES